MRKKNQKKPIKPKENNNQKKKPLKISLNLFCVVYLLLDMGYDRKCGLYAQLDSPGENEVFLCEWLSLGDSVWVRDGVCVCFPSVIQFNHHIHAYKHTQF